VAVGSLSDFFLLANGMLDAGWSVCGNPVSTGTLDTGCWNKWIKNQTINKISASSINHSAHNSIKLSFVLVLEFFIFPAEALNAAGCVNKLLFAGEKWMAF
jgi:hypothetical protein